MARSKLSSLIWTSFVSVVEIWLFALFVCLCGRVGLLRTISSSRIGGLGESARYSSTSSWSGCFVFWLARWWVSSGSPSISPSRISLVLSSSSPLTWCWPEGTSLWLSLFFLFLEFIFASPSIRESLTSLIHWNLRSIHMDMNGFNYLSPFVSQVSDCFPNLFCFQFGSDFVRVHNYGVHFTGGYWFWYPGSEGLLEWCWCTRSIFIPNSGRQGEGLSFFFSP